MFYSSASLLNNNPLLVNDVSRALISVNFTLTETIDYAFSGTFNGTLDRADDPGVLHVQTIEGVLAESLSVEAVLISPLFNRQSATRNPPMFADVPYRARIPPLKTQPRSAASKLTAAPTDDAQHARR
jgi:hypothetical protein